uniref:DUF4378 domain-containing protein n=1 Tax=Globisporangium ultimum (strain ATCC 200006 / CBS 805.95 / DAOM BR144) TaxID=431595 RepID=K3WMI2_GLOUD
MTTQLAFSTRRTEEDAARRGSAASSSSSAYAPSPHTSEPTSPRGSERRTQYRVKFTVQNVPPSPLVYQHQVKSTSLAARYAADSGDEGNGTSGGGVQQNEVRRGALSTDAEAMRRDAARTKRSSSPIARRKENAARNTTKAQARTKNPPKKKVATRKPAWDADVSHTTSLFDGSIKKSTLFQPRPGDRRQEVEKENVQLKGRSQSLAKGGLLGAAPKRAQPVGRSKSVAKSVKSTIVTTSSLRLLPRPPRDFVRLNYERITGRPYDQSARKTFRQPAPSRVNVFDRLSTPHISKSVLLRSGLSHSSTAPQAVAGSPRFGEEEIEALTKASLFPLVDQAGELLREIQKRQGAKLSLIFPQECLSTIGNHSDALASAILDDILLDTAQMLNAEERWKSEQQVELHHANQLDAILDQIKQIEEGEDRLIQQGQKYQQHRRLVEASLSGSGIDQCAVIEILEEMLTNELIEECTKELDENVSSLADTLATTLV